MWLKEVTGFDPSFHCAKCLKGRYLVEYGLHLKNANLIKLSAEEESVYYACGVASPYKWANNMHLAMKAKLGSICQINLYNGDTLTFSGFQKIDFNENVASSLFPEKNANYLTCRNFQFGSFWFMGNHLVPNDRFNPVIQQN